jgi:hypothetical protein
VSEADIDPRYLIRSHYPFPIRTNISPTPPRPSTMPAGISSEHDWCFCRSGAMREIGPNGNMRCGMLAGGLRRQAIDRASPPIASGSIPAAR